MSMLRTGCYVKHMKSIKFSTLHRLFIWRHRWILVLLLIFVNWYKHSNTNIVGSRCILNRFLVYNLKTKSDFFIKMSTLHNGLHNKFELYVFPMSLVLNLAYIDYSLCLIWSIHMVYLQCCDHSNKCLFLVIQQVLVNFFWWVYVMM